MSNNTLNFQIQLVEAMQSGKTFVINEALSRIDWILSGNVRKKEQNSPPENPISGDCYIISRDPIGEWRYKENCLAYFEDHTWKYIHPRDGQRVWVQETSEWATYVSQRWHYGVLAIGVSGGKTSCEISTFEIELSGKSHVLSDYFIPEKSIVLGVSGVILSEVIGAPYLKIGVPESINRYGEHHYLNVGAKIIGLTSSPLVYYSSTQISVTSSDNQIIQQGKIQLSAHTISILS